MYMNGQRFIQIFNGYLTCWKL